MAEIVEKGNRIGVERWSYPKTVLVDIEENDEIELGLFFSKVIVLLTANRTVEKGDVLIAERLEEKMKLISETKKFCEHIFTWVIFDKIRCDF